MSGHDRLYIDGRWTSPAGSELFEVVSAGTEEIIGTVPAGQAQDVDRAVAAARAAFDSGPWPRLDPAERGAALGRLSKALQARSEELAVTISQENGTPVAAARLAQVLMATMTLDYYAGLAPDLSLTETRAGMLGPAVVRRRPVGVVGAIVAWNVPLYLSALKLGPALLAGCTVVLKPAPDAPLSLQLLAEAADEADLPPGVLNVVPAERDVSEYLVTHPGVDKISFTGSTAAGRRIAALCGERLRRVSLELGGKGAAIVLPDADLSAALPGILQYGFMLNGQACVAQTRILAPRARYAELVEGLLAQVGALKVGDPLDEATELGPLASARQRDRVEEYIRIGRDEGARLALGGGRPAGHPRGYFVEPTVFTDVDPAMRIAQEEIFGPVLTVIPYDTVDDAVGIANGTPYGLGGSIWTADVAAGYALADRIEVGVLGVNMFMLDNVAPFGGFKDSGLGRELGPEALAAYLDHQTVNLPAGATVPGV
ncbi:aldehyde dehydrogenase [Parafrankia colletiae]|uniref:aldehyde dehydrogenase (NAD(+)) n=1 Tax=Parafrankia colletiae TaxID=573497 RepID=A0A1S1QJH5_9ACTN|nr:aldehyde dehydrogenase [Parafrankia colletiae]MCK9902076.1 aldehyde dehydrogenase [Frankia sp. Cpl3]OHV34928.1 aldehyde dehydrogenase [Parafrankia colletiae]